MDVNNEECENNYIIPGYKDAAAFSQEALCSILGATRSSNELPSAGDDFDYYSTFQGFRAVMLRKGQSILSLMTSLIQNQGIREKFQGRELEEKFDLLIDVNDVILENVSSYLDEATGLKKSEEELVLAVKPANTINTSWNKKFNSNSGKNFKLLTAKNISRPQLTFKDKIDNSNSLFVPIIKEKPNSIKPLAIILEKDGEREEFCHPYEWELEKFFPGESVLQTVEPVMPKPLEKTPLIMIKNVDQLKQLCAELKQQKEFAIDLEHHSYRSYQGFTCLMQISTREKDYIVDVLELRSELHILNEVFTDPKIVKILHGADMDIIWLQKDFGIYVVNLFDTGQAARVLHFAHLSLSYLLKHYLRLDLDKQFQLADWRIRPLPEEMVKYARQDTHYLLYVYDCLKNDLIKNGNETKNLLRSTFERSTMVCLKRYRKPIFNEEKYLDLYRKSKKMLNAKQLYCLKELYAWRDRIARENDESLPYVLPNHMLLQIAAALPREQQGILACCNPIPPLVKQQLNELHSIVLKASESSLKQLETLELQKRAKIHKENNQIDLSNLVHCPHDILHLEDNKTHNTNASFNSENQLPLITKKDVPEARLRKKPAFSALFDSPVKVQKCSESREKITEKVSDIITKLVSPFHRYKVTEQLQSSQERKGPESCSEDKSSEDESNVQQPSVSSTNERIIESNETSEKENPSSQIPSSDISYKTLPSVPLRKKVPNKKRKRKRLESDIPLSSAPQCDMPPRKKSCSPESKSNANFHPFDYSHANLKVFLDKKNSKKQQKLERQGNSKAQQKFFGKRKQNKQATFSSDSKHMKKNNAKWPKNK